MHMRQIDGYDDKSGTWLTRFSVCGRNADGKMRQFYRTFERHDGDDIDALRAQAERELMAAALEEGVTKFVRLSTHFGG